MTKNLDKALKDVKLALNRARSIIVVQPEFPTLDNASATKLLVDLFTKQLNKPTKILAPKGYKLPRRIADFIGYSEIPEEQAIYKISPLAYKITVPEVDIETKVEWKIEGGKFEVVLQPKEGRVDLSKTSFDTEGQRYDLLITVGAQTKEMLNSAYKDSKDAAPNMITVNFDTHPSNTKYAEINVIEPTISTVTELVYQLYKALGAKIEKENASLAMKTTVVSTDGLRRISSSKSLTTVIELEKIGEEKISELLRSHYLSLGRKGLTLREKMLDKIKSERYGSILLSTITKESLDKLEIDPDVLEGVEQLPFNICKGTKVAVLVYEYTKENWKALAIANSDDVNLFKWAKSLGGAGISNIGTAEIRGDEDTAVQTVVKTLNAEVFGKTKPQDKPIITPPPEPNEVTQPDTKPAEKPEKEAASSPFAKADEDAIKKFAQEQASTIRPSAQFGAKSPFERAKEFE